MHVYGGRKLFPVSIQNHVMCTACITNSSKSVVSPTGGAKKIVDVLNGNRIRGYKSCVDTNVNRLVNGYTPLQAADPPTILAKGMLCYSVTGTSL